MVDTHLAQVQMSIILQMIDYSTMLADFLCVSVHFCLLESNLRTHEYLTQTDLKMLYRENCCTVS